MEEDKFDFSYDEEAMQAVHKFEAMKNNNEKYFFDVVEFESIIDYYIDCDNSVRAFEAATIASEQHPNSIPIQIRKAKVFLEKGRAVEALSILKKLENIDPGNSDVYIAKGTAFGILGDIQGAKRMFDYSLTLESEDVVDVLFSIVSVLQNLNYYEQVIPYLKRLVAAEPEIKGHVYDLAYAYDKIDDFNNAIKFYQEYLEEDPFSDSAWYNLGVAFNKVDDYDKAMEAFDFALAINSDNTYAILNKANIFFNQENYVEAIRSYHEYLDIEPDSFEAMTFLAECYEKNGESTLAKKYYLDSLEIAPEYADTWFGLGVIELNANNLEESFNYFLKATRLDSDIPEYWYYLGKVCYLKDDLKTALKCFREALKQDSYYDIVWVDMGRILMDDALVGKAIPLLERAHKTSGDISGITYLLSAFYLHVGEVNESLRYLSTSVENDKDSFSLFRDFFPIERLPEEITSFLKEKKMI